MALGSGRPLAEGYVRIRADTSELRPALVAGTREAIAAAGPGASRDLASTLTAGVRTGTRAALPAAEEGGRAIGGRVSDGLAGKLRAVGPAASAAGRDAGGRFTHAVKAEVDRGGGEVEASARTGARRLSKAFAAAFVATEAFSFFKEATAAARENAQVQRITENAIRATGGAAHVTASQVEEMASRLSEQSGVDDDLIQHGANLILTFRNIRNEAGKGNDIFDQATQSALDLSAAGFGSIDKASILLGKALNDPIKGLLALGRAGVTFSEDQKTQIKQFVQTGNLLAAQKVILGEVGRQVGGAARASADPVARLGAIWHRFQEQIGGVVTGPLNAFADFLGGKVIPEIMAAGAAFDSIPGPLKTIIGIVTGGGAAFLLAGLALNNLSKLAKRASEGFASVGIKVGSATRAVEGVEGSVGRATGAVGRLRAGFGGVLGAISPWGIALAAGTALLGLYIDKQAQAAQEVSDFSDALSADSGALGTHTAALAAHKLETDGTLASAQRLGLSIEDVTAAALGNTDALGRIKAATQGVRTTFDGTTSSMGYTTKSIGEQGTAATDLIARLESMNGSITSAAASTQREASAAKGATEALKGNADAEQRAAAAAAVQKAALDKLHGALTAANNILLIVRGGERGWKAAIDNTTESLRTNHATLDVNTAKGRANAQALDDLSAASLGYLDSLVKNNVTAPVFAAAQDKTRAALIRAARNFGMSTTAAANYARQILDVPTAHALKVTTPGLPAASNKVKELDRDINGLNSKGVNVTVSGSGNLFETLTTGPFKGKHLPVATGGFISGPGGPTSDSIPARLSNGEYVINARATSQHRQLLDAINGGQTVKRFATGGAVTPLTISGRPGFDMQGAISKDYGWLVSEAGKAALAAAKALQAQQAAAAGPVGAGVRRWLPTVLQALRLTGNPASAAPATLSRMQRESGGNPTIVNKWDSNWKAGHPSVGLMQVIRGTFAAYAGAYRNRGPFLYGVSTNPLANIYASMRYAKARYGSLTAAFGKAGGYDEGGLASGLGLMAKATIKPERVLSPSQSQAFEEWMGASSGPGGTGVRLHPDTVAELGGVMAAAMARATVRLDGRTVAGYVDRGLGTRGLSVRG